MSKTYVIKQRKSDVNDSPITIDVERSILDVRKVYPELSIEDFARKYHRKYRIAGAVVKKLLEIRDDIIRVRKEHGLLTTKEFIAMYSDQQPKVKKRFIEMVVEDYEKELTK